MAVRPKLLHSHKEGEYEMKYKQGSATRWHSQLFKDSAYPWSSPQRVYVIQTHTQLSTEQNLVKQEGEELLEIVEVVPRATKKTKPFFSVKEQKSHHAFRKPLAGGGDACGCSGRAHPRAPGKGGAGIHREPKTREDVWMRSSRTALTLCKGKVHNLRTNLTKPLGCTSTG